jgi:hypothetical protein
MTLPFKEISPGLGQGSYSRTKVVLLFFACLAVTVWMAFFSFNYGIACGLASGAGFACKVIVPYFFISTLVLFVFSFFVPRLVVDTKRLVRVTSITLLLFLAGPWIALKTYPLLPQETGLKLEGYSVASCEKREVTQGNEERDRCFFLYAMKANDVRICDRIKDTDEREKCYFHDAGYGAAGTYKSNLTSDDCKRIRPGLRRDGCESYFNVKISTSRRKCEDITEGFDRWFCWSSVAREVSRSLLQVEHIDFRENYAVTYRPEKCMQISNDYLRDFCHFKYVGSLNETLNKNEPLKEAYWCEKIQNAVMKKDCTNGWGVVSGQVH